MAVSRHTKENTTRQMNNDQHHEHGISTKIVLTGTTRTIPQIRC